MIIEDLSPVELEMELTKYVCNDAFDSVFRRYYNSITKVISFKSKY